MKQTTCASCRYWHPAESVLRENASMGCCEHLSAYRSRTPFDYHCALFVPADLAHGSARPVAASAECPRCGLNMYVVRRADGRYYCSNCAAEFL